MKMTTINVEREEGDEGDDHKRAESREAQMVKEQRSICLSMDIDIEGKKCVSVVFVCVCVCASVTVCVLSQQQQQQGRNGIFALNSLLVI